MLAPIQVVIPGVNSSSFPSYKLEYARWVTTIKVESTCLASLRLGNNPRRVLVNVSFQLFEEAFPNLQMNS